MAQGNGRQARAELAAATDSGLTRRSGEAAKRITIAGAGIGGLAATAALARGGHAVTVPDRFDAPRPVLSGLVIQPVGQDVLAHLGTAEAAARMGNPITRMLGHAAGFGRPVLDVRYATRGGGRDGQRLCLANGRCCDTCELIVDGLNAASPLWPLTGRPLPHGAIWATLGWVEAELPCDQLRQCDRRADRMVGVLPLGRVPHRRGRRPR